MWRFYRPHGTQNAKFIVGISVLLLIGTAVSLLQMTLDVLSARLLLVALLSSVGTAALMNAMPALRRLPETLSPDEPPAPDDDMHLRQLVDLFEQLPVHFGVYTGAEHIMVYQNPAARHAWGGIDHRGKPLHEALPDLSDEHLALWDTVFTTDETIDVPAAPVLIDEEMHYFDSQFLPYYDVAGNIIGVLVFGIDVTERYNVQEALRIRDTYFRTTLKHSPITVFELDSDRRYRWTYNSKTDPSDSQLIGKRLSEVHPHLPEAAHVDAMRQRVVETGIADRTEISFPIAGETRYYDMMNTPLFDDDGNVIGISGAALDITLRRQAEEALRESEARFRQLAENIDEILVVHDLPSYDVLYVNPAYEKIWDESVEMLYADSEAYQRKIHPDDKARVLQQLQRAIDTREDTVFTYRIQRQPDDIRWIHSNTVFIYADDGTPSRLIGVIRDITEQKEAELEVQQVNASLEQRVQDRTSELELINHELEAFSYSVSHDLRAPLRAINGFSQALLEDYDAKLDDTGRDYLHRVRRASQRMGQLIDELLKLSRITRDAMDITPVNLSATARDVVAELRIAHPRRDVQVTIDAGLHVRGDGVLLETMLQNLLSNAWKFTRDSVPAQVTFSSRVEAAERIYYIRDNGAGYDPRYADKLFKPFQRLHRREAFDGNGIGLAIVQRIVHRHGGRIWAESAEGQGATFYFTLSAGQKAQQSHEN